MHDDETLSSAAPHPLSRIKGEFIWEGKYDVHGVKRLPDPAKLALPAVEVERLGVCGTGPHGSLFFGDNRVVMSTLLDQHRGSIDLIYMDPPFDVGSEFHVATRPATHADPIIAYDDRWGSGIDSYASALHERLVLARELLSPEGSIYVHCDWHCNWIVRALMNEVFGVEQFRNEIAWCYTSPGRNTSRFKPCHDTIFYFSRAGSPIWNRPQQPLAPATLQVTELKFAGQRSSWKRTRTTKDMVDWWNIPFPTGSSERSGYPTQKPRDLMKRIIEASSHPESIVADFYCGSGSFAVAAHELGRSWIACDASAPALAIARCRVREVTDAGGSCSVQVVNASDPQARESSGSPGIVIRDVDDHVEIHLEDDERVRAWSVGELDSNEVFAGIWHASRIRRTGIMERVARLKIDDDHDMLCARVVQHNGEIINIDLAEAGHLRAGVAAK